jgi:hypothetical protein
VHGCPELYIVQGELITPNYLSISILQPKEILLDLQRKQEVFGLPDPNPAF